MTRLNDPHPSPRRPWPLFHVDSNPREAKVSALAHAVSPVPRTLIAQTGSVERSPGLPRPRAVTPPSGNRGAYRPRKHSWATAFTLLEMVVVLTILAMVTLVAQPRLVEYADRDRLRRSAGRVRSDVRAVQAEAIRRRTRTAIVFDELNDFYVLVYEDASTVPPTWKPIRLTGVKRLESVVALGAEPDYGVGVTGSTLTDGAVIFDVYGAPAGGGQVTLYTPANEIVLDFSAGVGRVSYGDTSPRSPAAQAAQGPVDRDFPSNAEVAAAISDALGGAPVDLTTN